MKWIVFAGLVSGVLYGAALAIPDWGREFTRFLPVYGGLVIAYLVGLAGVGRETRWSILGTEPSRVSGPARSGWFLGLIWAGAVIFRGLVLTSDPTLSDDLYRYLWDGKVLLAGINPYSFAPDAQELAGLRDEHWSLINNPDLPTIYPPLLVSIFALAGLVSHSVFFWKIVVVLFDLLAALFLLKTLKHLGRSRKWVMLYLWHPLVVVEFAGSGHADAVGVMLVSAGLYGMARMNWFRSGAAFTLAGLVKFLPWVALPVLVRRLGFRWLLFPGIVALFYLLFARDGVDPLGSLNTFAAKWRANDFLFSLLPRSGDLDPDSGIGTAKILAAAVVAVVWLVLVARGKPLSTVYLWSLGALFLLSPVVHPWYLLWLLPALVIAPHPAWWVWTLTVILAYHPLPGFQNDGIWEEEVWIKTVEYLPVLLLLPAGLIRKRFGAP